MISHDCIRKGIHPLPGPLPSHHPRSKLMVDGLVACCYNFFMEADNDYSIGIR